MLDSVLELWPVLIKMKEHEKFVKFPLLYDFVSKENHEIIVLMIACMRRLNDFTVTMQSRTKVLISEGLSNIIFVLVLVILIFYFCFQNSAFT